MRGKGEGSIYKRKDGYWVGSVEAGVTTNGKRRQARIVRRRKADVLAELGKLREHVASGVVPDRTTTTGRYLDWWLDEVIGDSVAAVTRRKYRAAIERARPHVGHVKLHRLSGAHVVALSKELPRRYPSAGTRRVTLGVLRRALGWAVTSGMMPRNPADGVRTGKDGAQVKVDDTLTEDEAKATLRAAEGDDSYALVWLALKYGLRIGELLALRWTDVDWKTGELHVRKSKTAAGVRTLPLIPEAATVLRAHQKAAAVRRLDGYVFTRPDGRALSERRVRGAWSGFLATAGVTHMCRHCGTDTECLKAVRRFHVSRHTAATLLLEAGVPLEVVSAILGHANIGITAGLYAKVRSDLKRKGLSALA